MDYLGSTLNKRYRLDSKIGEGGFASVFLATDLELGRSVAIKLLGQDWARDKDLLTRFRNEARTVAALDHPHILPIYDYGVVKGAPYLVMPYISGGTLAARMKREQLTLDEIGVYLDQVSSALDYAHQRGVIHRDVKPANLLIRGDGQLMLMDFGLAKLLENAFLEVSTMVLGTVAYMAPEQCLGMVSAASDIYMLGIILYQMVAGKLPFEGNTTQIMVGHVHAVLAPLAGQPSMEKVAPPVVAALDQVLLKVLAKAPADRYPTCNALCSAYYNALRADPNRGRYNDRDKLFNVREIISTIVDKKQNIMPPMIDQGATVKPTDPAHLAYPEAPSGRPPMYRGEQGEMQGPVPTPQAPPPADIDATIVAPASSTRNKKLLKPPRLVVTTEPDKGFKATFNLTGDTITLGRATDNTIYLPLATISRYHADIKRINSESQELSYKIVQRKSINPLCFHGKEVTEKILKDGDTFEIGQRGFAEYVVKLTYYAATYE
jgi:serine/threonine protein kinase